MKKITAGLLTALLVLGCASSRVEEPTPTAAEPETAITEPAAPVEAARTEPVAEPEPVAVPEPAPAKTPEPPAVADGKYATMEARASYGIAYQLGMQMSAGGLQFNIDEFKSGYKDGVTKKDARYKMEAVENAMMFLQAKAQDPNATSDTPEEMKKIADAKNTVSYGFGYKIGNDITSKELNFDTNAFFDGFDDGFSNAELRIPQEQLEAAIQALENKLRTEHAGKLKELAEKNKIVGDKFLLDNKNAEGVTETTSGLQYKVINAGTGKKPKATDTVVVHYSGTKLDGTVFDSSYTRGEPAEFQLDRVIPGWTEALQLMSEGAKWKIFVPSELAYGEAGKGPIEPNSVLIFEVELIKVKDEAAKDPAVIDMNMDN